jgi:hypothetical protein
VGVFALALLVGHYEVLKVRKWRQEYPLVSLADRLAYEGRGRESSPNGLADSQPIVLTAEMDKRLNKEDASSKFTARRYLLERLHEKQYEKFVAATGFGVGRMMRVYEGGLKLREVRIPADEWPANRSFARDTLRSDQPSPLEDEIKPMKGIGLPELDALGSLDDEARQDFLDPERFGFIKDRKASGFVSHRLVFSSSHGSFDPLDGAWQLSRLNLVSLLKFSEPAI